jgi:nucleoside-diphosphate-sugar epimerase
VILVTGATGFVGRTLLDHLSRHGVRYRATSRTVREGFHHLPVIDGSTDWTDLLDGVDSVVHLAARAHILHEDSSDPHRAFFSVNFEGTLNLARQAQTVGVRRFVFVSSIGVNGTATTVEPFTESTKPAPQSIYAVSKYQAELGLQGLAEHGDMETVIVRPPLVYGADAPGNFGMLTRLIRRGLPLPLSAIQNKRSFVYVENLADFLFTCINHPAARNQTFLISDGEDLSTPDLLRRMAHAMGKPSRLVPVAPGLLRFAASSVGMGDKLKRLVDSLQVDANKARRLLAWRPPISVDEGLRRSLAADMT